MSILGGPKPVESVGTRGYRAAMATLNDVRELALALPGVEERTSFGTPAFFVRGRLFARIREDLETVAVKMEFEERERRLAAEPDVFRLTDHYLKYPMVLVMLDSADRGQLGQILEAAHAMESAKKPVRTRRAG